MNNNWKSKNRHKFLLQYHLIFVCKYRNGVDYHMTNKRKVEILTNEIDNLNEEIDSLKLENKHLYEQIHIQQNFSKENFDHMRETVSELDKKENEYDVLIRQCKDLKGKYEGLCDEMERLIWEFGRDAGVGKMKLFGGKRK